MLYENIADTILDFWHGITLLNNSLDPNADIVLLRYSSTHAVPL